jgi:PAS domain-containing protein
MAKNLNQLIEANLTLSVLGLLLFGFLGGISTYRFLLEFPRLTWLGGHSVGPCGDVTVVDAMNSSVLPMYVADKEMRVLHCNEAYARFIGVEKRNVIGKTIGDLVKQARTLVVPEDRGKFDKEQLALEKRALAGELPSADASYVFDLRQHPVAEYRSKYRVWIHVDRLSSSSNQNFIGTLGVFRPERIASGT